jgi:hypothetical protein
VTIETAHVTCQVVKRGPPGSDDLMISGSQDLRERMDSGSQGEGVGRARDVQVCVESGAAQV